MCTTSGPALAESWVQQPVFHRTCFEHPVLRPGLVMAVKASWRKWAEQGMGAPLRHVQAVKASLLVRRGPGAQTSCGAGWCLWMSTAPAGVSSAVNGQQPCEEELNTLSATRPAGWKPPAGQVEPRLVRPAWSQQRGQPVRGLMWCPVVAPRKPPQAPRSSQAATQPAASEPGPSTPPPAKRSKPAAEPTQPTKGEGKGKAAKAKPAPQPGRWLDRDCNAALNMQRIGESRWRPLELCYWPDQGALPAKGKGYPDSSSGLPGGWPPTRDVFWSVADTLNDGYRQPGPSAA
ncbi:hypothetical protein QJQ45_012540 [Haematococcus lacustris]|nr:hypothetical protein QJQ45_012540 [Haematococcus lacustris]